MNSANIAIEAGTSSTAERCVSSSPVVSSGIQARDAHRLLNAIHHHTPDDALIEFRAFDEGVRRAWVPPRSPHLAKTIDVATQLASEGASIYYAPCPRKSRAGTEAETLGYTTLWCDIDDATRAQEALDLMRDIMPPSAVVATGRGLHCYWLLDRLYSIAEAKPVNRDLSHRVPGADHCFDAARILRLPGTWNHKEGVERPVELLRCEPSRRYTIAEVQVVLATLPTLKATTSTARATTPLETTSHARGDRQAQLVLTPDQLDPVERARLEALSHRVSPTVGRLIDGSEAYCVDGRVDRSRRDFVVACALLEAGGDYRDFRNLMMLFPAGLGAKMREQYDPAHYCEFVWNGALGKTSCSLEVARVVRCVPLSSGRRLMDLYIYSRDIEVTAGIEPSFWAERVHHVVEPLGLVTIRLGRDHVGRYEVTRWYRHSPELDGESVRRSAVNDARDWTE